MKNLHKKMCAVMAAFLCFVHALIIYPLSVRADIYWPEGPSIETPNAIVMEVNTQTVLYEKNSHESKYPASITKIMTTLLAIENCELDEIVTFSSDAVYKNEGDTSHISRDVGEEMTMEQCLYGVMLASANECAYAVAEHVGAKLGGDYQTFIDLMNKRALELGCTDTHFNNCNGLPDPDHWTSAYDMALIAQEAYQNSTFRTITGTKKYTIPVTNKHSEETYLRNHHNMLYPYSTEAYLYDYCTGGKTGYTSVANSTLVTYAEKDGMTLVCVVMNTNSPNHFVDTTTLLDYYFNNFHAVNISECEDITTIDENAKTGVLNNNESFVALNKNAYIILPVKAEFSDISFEILENPDEKDAIAGLKYMYGEHQVGKVEIVASGAQVTNDFFHQKTLAEDGSAKDVIIIKPIHIIIILAMVMLLALLIYLGKKFYDNFYIIQHNRAVKRLEKQRFSEIKKRRRRRKKDRLFH